jgi:hypothetical protein
MGGVEREGSFYCKIILLRRTRGEFLIRFLVVTLG